MPAKRKGAGFSERIVDAMEAVRLSFPRDVTQLIHEFASDRVGVHPTASQWVDQVVRVDNDTWHMQETPWVEWRVQTDWDELGCTISNHFWGYIPSDESDESESESDEDDDMEEMT